MAEDLAAVFQVQALALLPGWEKSMGATVEVALAQFLGLPLFSAVTMMRLRPRSVPWSGLIHLSGPDAGAAVETRDYRPWNEVCGKDRG
jgi:hypothetical protein